MKFNFHFYYFLTLGIVALAFFGVPSIKHRSPKVTGPYTKEQRASHRITFINKDEDGKEADEGYCSATAVGPHSVLTAEHCNEDGLDMIRLDLAREKHTIIATAYDGRDHVVYLLSGSPFIDYEKPEAWPQAEVGATVTFYGDENGDFPPVPRYGKITDCQDISDVDLSAGELCFDIETFPGDSGSALYDVQGRIVGLITYRHDEDGAISGSGYALHFSDRVWETAYTFSDEISEPK